MTGNRNDSLEERRKRLANELAKVRAEDDAEARTEQNAAETRKGFAMAIKLSSEFIAAVIVGAMLGYLLDHFAGTSPWGMIVLLLLGFCAGVLNVLRSAGVVANPPLLEGGLGKDKGGEQGD
ncbi:AtpZ/AtpI family protein [Agrobacterium rubi]|uniref:ATP synthase protein I n=1 Tax=Agrobacterium rubi TaxID=28099 RepID=A0AAE7R8C4_9HYPH|nr:AtpZ/AtpI family protein [Agrobacterium rubi]NTE85524.1 F0F1 ATP synthase assembly protein [Agrobacterium rubi]NTF01456.1 F0F1 ATP synthase assembly protein [Agrobacterium rubi]NTF35699.1 F0F1 ATP synthase assembly protein [Agrobacterium rubi]OCJ48388.1 F0F1 ATP synthase assembly protein [Agrobacterium rubi]QTG00817.1 F0F1 ATP synthase assembly protein [Agrobacterium rubi]